MTPLKLQSLVTTAVDLDREISTKTEKLKELKKVLELEARTREDEHTPTEGGGWTWTAEGSNGCVARVTAPGAALKAKVDGEGKVIEKVRAAAGRCFEQLFRPALAYRPVENFRARSEELLGRAAGKLIRLCESESSPKVSFETKESTN